MPPSLYPQIEIGLPLFVKAIALRCRETGAQVDALVRDTWRIDTTAIVGAQTV